MDKPTTEDYKVSLEQFKAMRINALLNIDFYERNIKYLEKKLKKLDDDPKPEGVDELVKGGEEDGGGTDNADE